MRNKEKERGLYQIRKKINLIDINSYANVQKKD